MSSSDADHVVPALRAQEATGERLAARLRVPVAAAIVVLLWAGAETHASSSDTPLLCGAWAGLAYALGWWQLTRGGRYAPWMSYASVAIDLSLCYAVALASLHSLPGIYALYQSPLLWLTIGACNGLSALRAIPAVSWLSLWLSVGYGAVLASIAAAEGALLWTASASPATQGVPGFEALLTHGLAAAPALFAVRLSMRARAVVAQTVERERQQKEERAQLEWRLKVADRMVTVGTMSAGVAHEINNPLTYVIHSLEAAERKLRDDARLASVHTHVSRAQSGMRRVQEIVASLRTFSRVEDGPRVPVDLRSTLDAALTMAASEVKHRASVDIDQEEPFSVLGSEAKLGQVFLNLIVNAAQAIDSPDPRSQRIKIRITRDGEQVAIAISDTGSGIAPEHLGRIFDPFFTTKPVGSGTGLGLSICHSIIHELEGSIDVQSVLGEGTTFCVRLPLSERIPLRSSTLRPIPPRHAGKVLIVDDERFVAEALELMLADDHQVVLAESGPEALLRIRSGETFHAILCDLTMPGMSGIELFYELEAEHPQLASRVLFATGGASTVHAQSFVERMGSRVIAKPFRSDELRAKVRKVVGTALAQDLLNEASAHVHARDGAAHQ